MTVRWPLEGVQAVGVEDQRMRNPKRERARALGGLRLATHARSQRDGEAPAACPVNESQSIVRGGGGQRFRPLNADGPHENLAKLRGKDTPGGIGAEEKHKPRPPARRGLGREARGPGQADRAGDDEDAAEVTLVRVGLAGRELRERHPCSLLSQHPWPTAKPSGKGTPEKYDRGSQPLFGLSLDVFRGSLLMSAAT